MKYKLLQQIGIMSKYALAGLIIQASLSTMLLATNNTMAQRSVFKIHLSINVDQAQLPEVFELIESKTDFKFAYKVKDVGDKESISLNYDNESLGNILGHISRLSGLGFRRVNSRITVKEHIVGTPEVDEAVTKILELANIEISGKITDENGEGLPGASIIVKGTVDGTISDLDGNYNLIVQEGSTLAISYVGYKTVEVVVTDQTVVDVQLELDSEQLEEVVVIGYGTAAKIDLTGAVSSFDQKAVDRQPSATNLSELMRGTVPGLVVGTSTSPSGNSDLLVRGITSLGANNEPLLVVDDVIFQGSISSINPADIESVNVLKDASAAAVYGSRAASGVIIITTKKGTTGKPTINLRSSVGFAEAGLIEDVYGPGEFLDYKTAVFDQVIPRELGYYNDPNNLPTGVTLDEWLDYDGLGGTTTDPTDIWHDRLELSDIEKENIKAGNTLDWKDIIFQSGLRLNNTISVSGKSEKVSYYGSLGHVKNEGVLLFQESETLRGRLNLETKITDFLSAGINLQTAYVIEPTNLPNHLQIYESQSPYGSLFYDDGEFKHLPYDDALATNPYLWTYQDNYFRQREYFTNLYAKVSLPYGISYRINWSNRANSIQDYRFSPVIATLGDGGDVGSRLDHFDRRWMVDNIVNWKKEFGYHNFDLTFLFNVEKAETYQSFQSNSEFSPNDNLSYHNLGLGVNPVINADDTRSEANAMMARLNYSFLDRYYLTATVRRDGFSAFGTNNPYATFPALSVAWRLSDERFLKSDFIDDLKLRLSWGKNGNRDIGIYSALSKLQGTNYIYDQSTVAGINATDLANPDLRWESTESYNAGLDFSFFGSRLSGSIEYYISITDDLLLQRTLPIITGYTDVFANLGEVENKGFELWLNSINVDNGKYSWRSSLALSHNKNKINHLYGDIVDVLDDQGNVIGQREEDDIANGWYIGHAIDEIFDYKILGIWQESEVDEATDYGRVPGDTKLLDVNNDGTIDFDDQVFQGYRLPKYRVGLRNDFTYKNFDFSIFLNALLGYKGSNYEHFNFRIQQQRLNKIKTPYWTPASLNNEWARLDSKNSSPETNWYDDKSYLRIQNITLGYTFPSQILDKFNIKSLRLYANVQNLPAFTLGGWDYNWDVETSLPTPLITAIGLDLSF